MSRPACGKVEVLALVLAALPALAGPVVYGAARWWIAGLLACLSFLAAALWAVARPAARGRIGRPPGFAAWCLWTGWLFVRMFVSAPVPHASLLAFLHAASCLASGLVLADAASRSARVVRAMGLGFFIMTCAVSAYATTQWLRGDDGILFAHRAVENVNRVSGTFVSPNHFAHFMGMSVCAGLGACASRRLGFSARLFAAASVAFCLVSLMGTLSRAGWISTAAGLMLLGVLVALKRRGWFLLLTGLVPALLGLASVALWTWWPPFHQRWDRLLRGDARAVIWPDMVDMIRSRPLLGHGLGLFEEAAAAYRHRYHDYWATLNHAHNEALQVAVDHGLTGLAVALACVLILGVAGVRALRLRTVPGHYLLTAGWFSCLAQSYLHAMFDFSLRVFAINQAFMFLSVLCVTPVRSGEVAAAAPPGRGRWWRAPAGGAALTCAAASAITWWGSVQELRADVLLHTRRYNPPLAAQLMKRAMPVDFLNPYFPAELGKIAVDTAAGAADAAAAAGWIAEADRRFTRAEALKPRDLGVMRGRLQLQILRGDLESALVLARDMARLHPASIDCQTAIGDVLLRMGRYQDASDALHKAWLRSGCKDQRSLRLIHEALQGLKEHPPAP
ncbi:MAG: O-antigen ligase family protein [Kiritimatiellia bacterium]